MKKVLLLLPILATVSLHSMDQPQQPTSFTQKIYAAAKRFWERRTTTRIDTSRDAIVRYIGLAPYEQQLRSNQSSGRSTPITEYPYTEERESPIAPFMGPNVTLINYQTGNPISEEDLPKQ